MLNLQSISYSSIDEQQVTITVPEDVNLICINLSGGADSALLLYLVCEYLIKTERTDITINAIHCVDINNAPKTGICYDNILNEFDRQFPELTIKRNKFNHIEDRTKQNPITKGLALRTKLFSLVKQHDGKIILFNAGTCNPPKEVQEHFGVYHLRDSTRDLETAINLPNFYVANSITDDKGNVEYKDFTAKESVLISRPFLLVNKLFVSNLYNEIPFLKNDIFHLTSSCVHSSPIATKGWTKPCKNCWWCKEKFWAFNKYDYEKL